VNPSSTIIFVLTVGLLGCGKADREDSTEATSQLKTAAPAGEVAAPAPSPTTPPVKSLYEPGELWDIVAGMSRLDRMEKYVDGVGMHGVIVAIEDDPLGDFSVELDAGDGRIITLSFLDFGAKARAAGLEKGAWITASECRITNPKDNRMALVGCTFE
jgi:hypothetical protein